MQEPEPSGRVPGVGSPLPAPQRRFASGKAADQRAGQVDDLREERMKQIRADSFDSWNENQRPQLALDAESDDWLGGAIQVTEGGGDIDGYFDDVPEGVRRNVARGLLNYTGYMRERQQAPMAGDVSDEEFLQFASTLPQYPLGLETLHGMATLFSDKDKIRKVETIMSGAATQVVARTTSAAPAFAMPPRAGQEDRGDKWLANRSDISVILGLKEGLRREQAALNQGYGASGPLRPKEMDPAIENFYLKTIQKHRTVVLRRADMYGVSVDALGETPLNLKEAAKTLDELVAALYIVQPEVAEDEQNYLEIVSQAHVIESTTNLMAVLSAYAKANPDAEVTLADSMDVLSKMMQGEIREDELDGGAPSLLVSALKVIAWPDQATAALTTEGQPKVRPVEVVFEDGFVASDVVSATKHSLELQQQGYGLHASLEAQAVSEASRASALLETTGRAAKDIFRLKNVNPVALLGDTVDLATRAATLGGYGIGMVFDEVNDPLTGVRSDQFEKGKTVYEKHILNPGQRGRGHAMPVAIFDITSDEQTWANRFSNVGKVWGNHEAKFIMEGITDQSLMGSVNRSWGRNWATHLYALGWEFAVSPLNGVHTGLVSARRAAKEGRSILEQASKVSPGITGEAQGVVKGANEILAVTPKAATKADGSKYARSAKRLSFFDDGREMNTFFTGMYDKLADMFGRGSSLGTEAEDLASLILTTARDNPGKTTEELFNVIKNDPDTLRRLVGYIDDMGMEGYEQAAFMQGLSYGDARIRYAQAIWEGAEAEVGNILDVAGQKFGPAWTNAEARNKMMENARGIFFGPVGVPTTKFARTLERVNAHVADVAFGEKEASNKAGQWFAKLYTGASESMENGMLRFRSGLSADAYTNGLAVGGGMLPEVTRVPHRMKKMYVESYRRRMASTEQQAQRLVYDTFALDEVDKAGRPTGRKAILESRDDRVLVSLLAEVGEDPVRGAAVLWDNRELLREHGIKIPVDQARLYEDAARVSPHVIKMQSLFAEMGEGMVRHGIVEPEKLIDDYVTRIYRAPEARNRVREHLAEQIAKAKKETVGQAPPAPTAQKGTSARVRHGPVSIFDAIRHGLDPELDAAAVIYYRTLQYGEISTKANFSEKIAREYGKPVIERRETFGRMLQRANISLWEAQKRIVDAPMAAAEYNQSLGKVRAAIRDSNHLARRSGFKRLAQSLGVRMSELGDESIMREAMIGSDKFLSMAGSKQNNVLDKILAPSLREVLRTEAREIRALKKQMEGLRGSMEKHGFNANELAKLADDDLGMLSEILSKHSDEFRTLSGIRKQFKGSKRTEAYFKREEAKLSKEIVAETKLAELLEREKLRIAKSWDRWKERLGRLGYDEGEAAAAKSFDDVSVVVDDVPDGASVLELVGKKDMAPARRAYENYKKFQAQYVENAKKRAEAKARKEWVVTQHQNIKVRVAGAEGATKEIGAKLAAHTTSIAEQRKLITVEKGAKKKRLSAFEKASKKHIEASRMLRETEARVSAMMTGPAFEQFNVAVNRARHEILQSHKQVKETIAGHALKYDLEDSIVRHRALAPKGPKGAAALLAKSQKFKGRVKNPPLPAHITHDARGYFEADEMFKALGWTQADVSGLLFDVFGAHHLTEVPVGELKALVSGEGGMMAKVGRFLFNPADLEGRAVMLKLMGEQGEQNAREIAKLIGLKSDGGIARLQVRLQEALDEWFSRAAQGDEQAIKVVDKLPPDKLSRIYIPQDIGDAFIAVGERTARNADGVPYKSKDIAARMVNNRDSPVSRGLANTYIPLEIGLVHKQMMGEGLATAEGAATYALLTKKLAGFGEYLSILDPFNRWFKTGATVGRGSFTFGRRNVWFDGVKSMYHLGLYGAANPTVRAEFNHDMEQILSGASGVMERQGQAPIAYGVLRKLMREQSETIFAARLDQVGSFTAATSRRPIAKEGAKKIPKSEAEKRFKRFQTDITRLPRMQNASRRGVPTLERAQWGGVAAGGIAGAVAGNPLLGAALGFTTGTIASSARQTAMHTAGSRASKTDLLWSLGAAGNERMENWYRNFALWSFVKAGMAPQEATSRMLSMMRDYTNLTPVGQDIMRRLPVVFYNFMHQNAIAMGTRLANDVNRTTMFPRLLMSVTGREEGAEDYMYASSAILHRGKAYMMSDEFEAAIQLFDPIWQAVHGEFGDAGDAVAQSMSPILTEAYRAASQDNYSYKIPQPIAKRLYDRFGDIDTVGFKVGANRTGAVAGEIHAAGNFLMAMFGITVTANDVGKAQGWVDRGEAGRGLFQYMSGVTARDVDSTFDAHMEGLTVLGKRVFENLDWFQWEETAPHVALNSKVTDALTMDILNDLLKGSNMIFDALGEQKKLLNKYAGKDYEAASPVPTDPEGLYNKLER